MLGIHHPPLVGCGLKGWGREVVCLLYQMLEAPTPFRTFYRRCLLLTHLAILLYQGTRPPATCQVVTKWVLQPNLSTGSLGCWEKGEKTHPAQANQSIREKFLSGPKKITSIMSHSEAPKLGPILIPKVKSVVLFFPLQHSDPRQGEEL